MSVQTIAVYIGIGAAAGILSGMFGIGGGLIIIPALVYIAGFSQFTATGTSLAILLPPIGLIAAMEYYKRGNVNIQAAIVIAAALMGASWVGARITRNINELHVRFAFGTLLLVIGVIIVVTTLRKIHSQ